MGIEVVKVNVLVNVVEVVGLGELN